MLILRLPPDCLTTSRILVWRSSYLACLHTIEQHGTELWYSICSTQPGIYCTSISIILIKKVKNPHRFPGCCSGYSHLLIVFINIFMYKLEYICCGFAVHIQFGSGLPKMLEQGFQIQYCSGDTVNFISYKQGCCIDWGRQGFLIAV